MGALSQNLQPELTSSSIAGAFAILNSWCSVCSGFTAARSLGSDPNEQLLDRLASDSPALLAIARQPDLTASARRNLFRFLSSAITSSERYASVRSNPDALSRAMALFDSSEYLTEILVRHPEEIASLADIAKTAGRQGGGYLFD